jgi:hypothetical protein
MEACLSKKASRLRELNMANPIYASAEIIRFIEATGESSNIDAKAAMEWDGNVASAGLAKDIAAFANSRDGGIIVLGKSEDVPGKFQLHGMTAEQAASFDTTKVANWINSRFSPPIELTCHRQSYDNKEFVVITISEFGDVPHICTKAFQDPANPKNSPLRKGEIYIRSVDAASTPVSSVDHLRALIGLATAKRGHELVSIFDSMLKGRPILPAPSNQDLYDKEYEQILSGFGDSIAKMIDDGAWIFRVYPATYVAERWGTTEELEAIIKRRSVRLRDGFPSHFRGIHLREWGIANETYGPIWTFARSGQFFCVKSFYENSIEFVSPYRTHGGKPGDGNAAPGQWMDYKPSIFQIVELFEFLARLVEEYPNNESAVFKIQATNLAGRVLVSTDPRIDLSFGSPEKCRAQKYEFGKQAPANDLRTERERICAEAMKRFTDFFMPGAMNVDTMLGWIKRFQSRQF